ENEWRAAPVPAEFPSFALIYGGLTGKYSDHLVVPVMMVVVVPMMVMMPVPAEVEAKADGRPVAISVRIRRGRIGIRRVIGREAAIDAAAAVAAPEAMVEEAGPAMHRRHEPHPVERRADASGLDRARRRRLHKRRRQHRRAEH